MADDEEPTPDPDEQQGGGGNFLTNRVGPLPMWGWFVVVIGGFIVLKVIRGRQTGTGSTVAGQNNAASLFGTEGFSTNSAGQLVDNATGDILGAVPGGSNTTGNSGTGTISAAQWFANAQQTLFGLGFDSNAVDQALQDYAAGNQLPQNEYGIIEAAIRLTGNPPSGIALPTLQSGGGGSGGSGGGTAVAALPQINAQSWPIQVLFGQYAPGDYTQVGYVLNGQYYGNQVGGGAPVYAGLFGGFEQDFNMATLPNGTAIYVPTSLVNQGYSKPYQQPTQPAAKAA
jgi:hypothetical protein